MRPVRAAAAATALGLAAVTTAAGPASAASTGVGTSRATTTVLGVALGNDGSLLNLRLLTDDARSTVDAAVAQAPEAYSRLTPVALGSSVKQLQSVGDALPTLESRTPGGKPEVAATSVNLANPAPGVTVPAAIATGTVSTAALSTAVDPQGARSRLDAALAGVSLAGGLVAIDGVTSKLGATAASLASDGTRSVKVGEVVVLDLGALLDALGIDLAELPVATVTGLLTQLKATVPGIGGGAAVQAAVDGIQDELASLADAVDAGAGIAESEVSGIVGELGLGGVIPPATVTRIADTSDAVARANALIDELQEALASLLEDAVGTLDGLALLRASGAEAAVSAKAADTLGASAADVTAKLGSLSVGGVTIPGLDLGAGAAKVNALVSSVNGAVQSVLGAVDPGLAKVVSVSVLDQVKDVSSAGGYNRASAGVTVLTARIAPPANLAAIVAGVTSGAGVGEVVAGLGGTLRTATGMDVLETALGGVQALASGATVSLAQVSAASDFAPQAAAVPGGQLPRTGGSTLPLSALAALLIAAGLGMRQWLLVPARRA